MQPLGVQANLGSVTVCKVWVTRFFYCRVNDVSKVQATNTFNKSTQFFCAGFNCKLLINVLKGK